MQSDHLRKQHLVTGLRKETRNESCDQTDLEGHEIAVEETNVVVVGENLAMTTGAHPNVLLVG